MTRMNFAAQFFYSRYLGERLERLFSPRPALKDSEENDPFWQRWEITTCSPHRPLPYTPTNPVVTSLLSAVAAEVGSTSTASVHLSSVTSTPPPHPLCLQPTLPNTNLQFLPLPPIPHLDHKREATEPTSCLPFSKTSLVPTRSPSLPSPHLQLLPLGPTPDLPCPGRLAPSPGPPPCSCLCSPGHCDTFIERSQRNQKLPLHLGGEVSVKIILMQHWASALCKIKKMGLFSSSSV